MSSSGKKLIKYIQKLNYIFLDENLNEIPNIFYRIERIQDGGSENFFLI